MSVHTNYDRAEAVSEKLGIECERAKEAVEAEPSQLDSQAKEVRIQAHQQLGVLADPEIEKSLLDGYEELKNMGYTFQQDEIDNAFELLEGVCQEERILNVLAASAAYATQRIQSQIRTGKKYGGENDPTQVEFAEAFDTGPVAIRDNYSDIVRESDNYFMEQMIVE